MSAPRLPTGADQQVPLEALARLDADVLILDRDDAGGPSLADAVLEHPVVRRWRGAWSSFRCPRACGPAPGPELGEAVRRLVAATAGAREAAR